MFCFWISFLLYLSGYCYLCRHHFCRRHRSSAVFCSVFHGSIIRLRAEWKRKQIYNKNDQAATDKQRFTHIYVRTHMYCVSFHWPEYVDSDVYLCVHILVWSMIMVKCYCMRFADFDSFCHHRFSSPNMQCMVNEERLVCGKGQADICQDTDMQACKNHIYNDRNWWCRQGLVIIIICNRFYQRFIYIQQQSSSTSSDDHRHIVTKCDVTDITCWLLKNKQIKNKFIKLCVWVAISDMSV